MRDKNKILYLGGVKKVNHLNHYIINLVIEALITLENIKDEVRGMLRMTELLEDTINGSIENNFTVRS